ncbi:MAG: hypothetical protein WD052_01345 [Bacteroidales bacterium]
MKKTAKENLLQLRDLVQVIGTEKYIAPSDILSGATIGQHIRHILEFYLLLISGSFSGNVTYDKRERDLRLENDPHFASKVIDRLLSGINTLDLGQAVKFEADYSSEGTVQKMISSSVGRELAYCIEHSIHHQAIIKAGLIDLNLATLVNSQFGVAYSTIRYRNDSCAQ